MSTRTARAALARRDASRGPDTLARTRLRARGTRRTGLVLALLSAALVPVVLLASPAVAAGGPTAVPSVRGLSGARFGVRAPIRVLSFSNPSYSLAVGLANHSVDGTLERPSVICRTTPGCVAAVNGDYFDVTPPGAIDPGDVVGGIIQDCVLLHTPEISHQEVNLDQHTVSQGLNWSSTLVVNGTGVPITAVNQELPMRYPGVDLPLAGTLLYTPAYYLATPFAPGWTTYRFTQVNPNAAPTTINTTAPLQLVGTSSGPVHVAAGELVVVAPPGSPLTALTPGSSVSLTTTSSAGCNELGGHPILLDRGVPATVSRADTYMWQRYPRTVLGWTSTGATVLLTVGGTDERAGATAGQLIKILQSLDVVTAISLDGGQSTSLYAGGRVEFHPGRVERPVATALLVIAETPTSPGAP